MAQIKKHLVPEARVKQMQHRVFGSADVKIDTARFVASHPVALRFFANEALIVLRVAKPQIVPTWAGPLRHRVRLAQRLLGITNPIFRFRERRFAGAARLVIIQRRWHDWQFIFIHRPMFPLFPNNRKRLAPITLPRKKPVAQLVIHLAPAMPIFFQPIDDFLFRFRCR